MKTKRIARVLVIALFVISAFSSVPLSVKAQNESLYETLFFVPTGENGIHYAGVGIPEALTWGPAALTISNDGIFWITDTVAGNLLAYNSKGELISKIDLNGLVVGATDIVVKDNNIFVLDQASLPPKIVEVDMRGNVLGSHDLPNGLYLENGLTGITTNNHGDLLVEREFGSLVTQFLGDNGELIQNVTINGYIQNGNQYSAHISGLASDSPKHGEIDVANTKIDVETANDLGGLQILGFGASGDFYVIVEELTQIPELQVDQTIRHYSIEGNLLGIARMPINDQFTYVAQDFALSPDGNLYALVTQPDRVDVVRLNFFEKLEPILKVDNTNPSFTVGQTGDYSPLSCVSRDTMISTAASYRNNSKYFNSTNTDGTCSGRGKPRYISGAGTYSSVPYDYNGFDSVSGFNGYMDPNNYQAGDIDTTASESCSKGVDCSGYVSRAWQLSS